MATILPAILLALGIVLFAVLLYRGQGYRAWTALAALAIVAWAICGIDSPRLFWCVTALSAIAAVLFGVDSLRQRLVSAPLMRWVGGILPQVGETERTALDAGTVWWDGELFSGAPDWRRLLDFPAPRLTEAEQAFLDGPVDELCALIDDWQIAQDRALPEGIWEFLRKNRFFGMIIPEEFAGSGFPRWPTRRS